MGFDVDPPLSIPASGDLSASQYCGVTLNASGQLVLPAAGAPIIGILYTKPAAAGRAGEVYPPGTGIRKGKIGAGGVTAGDDLKVDASGQFVTGASTNLVVGKAVATAAASTVGTVLLLGAWIKP